MDHPVVQWQIVAQDPSAVTSFYSKLFGWKVSTENALGYRQIATGGLDGGVWPSPPGGHSFVQLFVRVANVEQSIADATRLGAKVIVPATALPDGDTIAILADPAGMTFGVTTPA
jgi:uncharacterized protein